MEEIEGTSLMRVWITRRMTAHPDGVFYLIGRVKDSVEEWSDWQQQRPRYYIDGVWRRFHANTFSLTEVKMYPTFELARLDMVLLSREGALRKDVVDNYLALGEYRTW